MFRFKKRDVIPHLILFALAVGIVYFVLPVAMKKERHRQEVAEQTMIRNGYPVYGIDTGSYNTPTVTCDCDMFDVRTNKCTKLIDPEEEARYETEK